MAPQQFLFCKILQGFGLGGAVSKTAISTGKKGNIGDGRKSDVNSSTAAIKAFFLILNNALRFGAVALLGSVINFVGCAWKNLAKRPEKVWWNQARDRRRVSLITKHL